MQNIEVSKMHVCLSETIKNSFCHGYQLLKGVGRGIANNGFIPVFTESINLFLQGNIVYYLKVLEMLI